LFGFINQFRFIFLFWSASDCFWVFSEICVASYEALIRGGMFHDGSFVLHPGSFSGDGVAAFMCFDMY
jgi:hypothetical protein